MLNETLVLPPLLFAYTVYNVSVIFCVGVPLITPPANVSPEGNAGSISHEEIAPPLLFIARSVIVCSLVYIWSLTLLKEASGSLIVILNGLLAEPPELFA